MNERWDESEDKVRQFIANDLNVNTDQYIEFERVHRLRSANKKKNGPIIAKFTRFKDRETVIAASRIELDKDSSIRVSEDFTSKVRLARQKLGEELVRARRNGQYASIRFDKLIVEDKIYKYDPTTQKPKYIGETSRRNPNRNRSDPSSSQMPTQQNGAYGADTDNDLSVDILQQ